MPKKDAVSDFFEDEPARSGQPAVVETGTPRALPKDAFRQRLASWVLTFIGAMVVVTTAALVFERIEAAELTQILGFFVPTGTFILGHWFNKK